MNGISRLKQEVADYLQKEKGLEQVRFLTAFPAEKRDFPLSGPMAAVGLEGAEASPWGLDSYWGEGAEGPVTGPGVLLTLRLDLYAPAEEGGDRLHLMWEAICAGLMTAERPFGVQKLWCGETGFDSQTRAWRLTAKASLQAVLAAAEGGAPIREIQLRQKEREGRLC